MGCFSVQPRDQVFVKDYEFLFFAKNMSKKITKNLSSKNSQKFLDHAIQSATDTLKTALKKWFKTVEATGDLIDNKIAVAVAKSYNDKIRKASKRSPQMVNNGKW